MYHLAISRHGVFGPEIKLKSDAIAEAQEVANEEGVSVEIIDEVSIDEIVTPQEEQA